MRAILAAAAAAASQQRMRYNSRRANHNTARGHETCNRHPPSSHHQPKKVGDFDLNPEPRTNSTPESDKRLRGGEQTEIKSTPPISGGVAQDPLVFQWCASKPKAHTSSCGKQASIEPLSGRNSASEGIGAGNGPLKCRRVSRARDLTLEKKKKKTRHPRPKHTHTAVLGFCCRSGYAHAK